MSSETFGPSNTYIEADKLNKIAQKHVQVRRQMRIMTVALDFFILLFLLNVLTESFSC